MPTVTFTYQLPEEQTDYNLVVHAFDLKTVIRELDEELRYKIKHADEGDGLSAGRQAARELLRMLIAEYEVHNLIFEE